eukprot:807576-Pyramimonas_sp.AAC.1
MTPMDSTSGPTTILQVLPRFIRMLKAQVSQGVPKIFSGYPSVFLRTPISIAQDSSGFIRIPK